MFDAHTIVTSALTAPQVLDPADRLGVEPKSSPSELRDHPLFSAQSPEEDPSTPPISWDSLWTDPPPPIETGIAAPTQPHGPGDEEDLWESMVQEFSLANLRSPGPLDGDPLSPNGLLTPSSTSTPVDIPPDAVPSVVVKTVSPAPDAIPGAGSPKATEVAAKPEAPASEEAPATDPVFKDRDW